MKFKFGDHVTTTLSFFSDFRGTIRDYRSTGIDAVDRDGTSLEYYCEFGHSLFSHFGSVAKWIREDLLAPIKEDESP